MVCMCLRLKLLKGFRVPCVSHESFFAVCFEIERVYG